MKTQRLSRLADLLEAYPGDSPRFDLEGWTQIEVKRSGHLWWRTETICNTTACAVGLACLSGTFKDDGLSYSLDKGGLSPIYSGHKDYPAVQKFFGLTENQAYRLFSADNYDGPTSGPEGAKAVAVRIRQMVAKRAARKSRKTTPAVEKIKREALAAAE